MCSVIYVCCTEENCPTPDVYGNRSGLCYRRLTNVTWHGNCTEGFQHLAITSQIVQEEVNQLLLKDQAGWVRGTNMRWVWITGL